MDLVARTSRGRPGDSHGLPVERMLGFFIGGGLRRWPRSGCGVHRRSMEGNRMRSRPWQGLGSLCLEAPMVGLESP
jgi:hypothetical protein